MTTDSANSNVGAKWASRVRGASLTRGDSALEIVRERYADFTGVRTTSKQEQLFSC